MRTELIVAGLILLVGCSNTTTNRASTKPSGPATKPAPSPEITGTNISPSTLKRLTELKARSIGRPERFRSLQIRLLAKYIDDPAMLRYQMGMADLSKAQIELDECKEARKILELEWGDCARWSPAQIHFIYNLFPLPDVE